MKLVRIVVEILGLLRYIYVNLADLLLLRNVESAFWVTPEYRRQYGIHR